VIEHRFLAEADRENFGAFVAELFGAQAAALGWAPAAGTAEDDETRLRRAVLLRALVLLARAPAAVAEAAKRLPSSVPGGAAGAKLDPNLLDIVVTAAARGADEAGFDELRTRARGDADPAAKRRYLHALARVESPALTTRAVEMALGPEVPMQDFSSYVGVLLGNRATREAAFRLIGERWTETRAKADSPMILRRLVESMATLPERRHLDEVRAFLATHPIDGARQATAQTLERMQMDADLRDRILGPVGAWLGGRGKRNPQAGVGRPGGLFAAALTAAAVFFLGQQLIPQRPTPKLPPPPAVPARAPLPATAVDATGLAPTDGPAAVGADAAARADAAGRADREMARPGDAAALSDARGAVDASSVATKSIATADDVKSTAATATADKNGEKQSDKDVAREAWRRNLPDVTVDGPRATLLIPLKGSSQGATFHVTNRPHAVVVKLPRAASMITMRLYRVDREGFRLVRINQAEKDAKPEDGTELKISLTDSGGPDVEIKDDYVRVTVRRPSQSPSDRPAAAPDAGNN
jgi:ERAP1-like C-terminal domain